MDQSQSQSSVVHTLQELHTKLDLIIEEQRKEKEYIRAEFTNIHMQFANIHEDMLDLKQGMRFARQDLSEIRKDLVDLYKKNSDLNRKIDEIHQARHYVQVKFGREWTVASFAIALLASGLASGLTKFLWR